MTLSEVLGIGELSGPPLLPAFGGEFLMIGQRDYIRKRHLLVASLHGARPLSPFRPSASHTIFPVLGAWGRELAACLDRTAGTAKHSCGPKAWGKVAGSNAPPGSALCSLDEANGGLGHALNTGDQTQARWRGDWPLHSLARARFRIVPFCGTGRGHASLVPALTWHAWEEPLG